MTKNMDADDAKEIDRLGFIIARQRKAHYADLYPTASVRRDRLRAMISVLTSYRLRIREALAEDFGYHPGLMSDLIETSGGIARAAYAIEHLDSWMMPEQREVEASFGNATAWMEYQPKGVVGNMVPWNFPFEIGCGAVTEMLAAGNRVIIKPSELTPACAALLREMMEEAYDPDVLTTVLGGSAVAKAFSEAPLDHLLFTGSTEIGRHVMRAAAARLTPLTLELGSKSPAILTASGVTKRAVESIIGLKLAKSGQVCVSVDHVFVPSELRDKLIDMVSDYINQQAPGFSHSEDCTSIISERHFARIEALIADAEDKGAEIVVPEAGGSRDRASRRMPLSLVLDPTHDMRVAQEEIFGPILPIFAYDKMDDVIEQLAQADKPLSIYIFGDDQAEIDTLMRGTISGGVTVNGAALNTACISLGFGGVGASGMGRHHGIEGFHEFSNFRAFFVRGDADHADVIFPPYGQKAAAVVDMLFPDPSTQP